MRALLAAALTVPLLVAAPVSAATPGVPAPPPDGASATAVRHRGDVLAVTGLGQLTHAQVTARLEAGGFSGARVRTGVSAYRLSYATDDPAGRPTRASGLVVLPQDGDARPRLVLHAHGTTTIKREVPSSFRDPFETGPALTFAGAGFAVAAPDYLGLGTGAGRQAWFDVPSETTASLDLLRATRTFAAEQGRDLRRGVDVTGFSQGASAALGVGRALTRHPRAGSRLHALAPVSGAYAFREVTLPAVLDGRVEPRDAVVYVALLLTSWNRLHHLYGDPAELFRAPYAARVERLLGGHTPAARMVKGLPGTVRELLTPTGLRLLQHPTGHFATALAVADAVCDWTPAAPTRLAFADGDEQAVPGNTGACLDDFRARGAAVGVHDLGRPEALGSRHLGSNVAGTLATVRWFSRLDR